MSILDTLFARYQNRPNSCVQITDEGDNYLIVISGGSTRPGLSKAFLYSKDNFSIGGTGDRWVTDTTVYSEVRVYDRTIQPVAPPSPPPAPEPPPAPSGPDPDPDFGNITSSYSTQTGYGEVDLRRALKEITGEDLPEVADFTGDSTVTRSGALEAHAAGYTGEDIIVAVIDTGLNIDHIDIDDNLWINPGEIAGDGIDNDGNGYIDDVHGWNTALDNNDISDIQGHGTHVSGIIAAEDNGIGRIGVAPNVKIMTVKSFRNNNGSITAALPDTDEAIIYAVDNGAHVINMSLDGPSEYVSPGRLAALQYAEDNGVVVVMASGNDGGSRPGTPAIAAVDVGIAVGSVNSSGDLSSFTNRAGGQRDYLGDGLDNPLYVTANGALVSSLSRTSNTGSTIKSGTSMAAPVVAGAVAVMLQANPNLDVNDIKVILANTSYDSIGTSRGF